MASPFAVTVGAATVTLDSTRHGTVTCTVSNTAGRSLRARAGVVPIDGSPSPSWFTLTGDAEREMPSAATEQFVVQVAVPPDAAAGAYSFRLDVVNVALPDEEFTHGPTVSFTIAAPPPPKKPFPWWIVAVIAVVVLLVVGGGIGFAVLRRPAPTPTPVPPVAVPTVTTLAETDAIQRLQLACQPQPCFQIALRRQTVLGQPPGIVIDQSPGGGTRLAPGSTVTIVVSRRFPQVFTGPPVLPPQP
ncbi:MAG: PASTA domain-containing protein [Chloroflexota bacterium]